MDFVHIADFTKELREELIVLVFEAFYPNKKNTYDERFIKSLVESSTFLYDIYYKDKITAFEFDKEFGCGTLQDLVECLRISNPNKIDILNLLEDMSLN